MILTNSISITTNTIISIFSKLFSKTFELFFLNAVLLFISYVSQSVDIVFSVSVTFLKRYPLPSLQHL